jgi:hypothetical protein
MLHDNAAPSGVEGVDYKWVEDDVWTTIDSQGREYPCAEYCWSEDGFETDED